jgi:hypothetical protein
LPRRCQSAPGTITADTAWSHVRILKDAGEKRGGFSMIMKKSILSLVAATALGLAVTAAPKPANAVVWWVVPAIAAGVVGGAAVGAATTNAAYAQADYGPRGAVYVQPTAGCHWARVQTASGALVRERICP